MAEALVMASTAKPATPRGTILGIKPDGWPWTANEGLPKFVVIKVPLIAEEVLWKYALVWRTGLTAYHGRRLWQIRYADLPLAARNKLATEGNLVIKATANYGGPFDYTWAQVKQFFRNLRTGLDETDDL